MQARVPPAPRAQSKGRLAQMVQQLASVDHAAMHHDDGPGGMPARLVSKQKYFDWQARFLPEDEARSVVALAQRFGVWRMHSEGEVLSIGYGAGEGLPELAGRKAPARLGQRWFPGQPGPAGRVLNENGTEWIFPHRYDMAVCLPSIRENGKLYGRENDPEGTSRTNFFRETWAYRTTGPMQYYGKDPQLAKQVEKSLTHAFAPAARELYGRPLIEPNLVYCNMLRPGEEIGTHSDVPEFRGINRTSSPSWLVVLCHMSNLFEDYRVYSATGISYYQDVKQGRMASYHGLSPHEPGIVHPARFNTAVLLDTDSTYHHTDRVAHREHPPQPEKEPGTVMHFDASSGVWVVSSACGERLFTHNFDDMRMSVSWKARCFRDEGEKRTYEDHTDDLTKEAVFATLVADMQRRGLLGDDVPGPGELIPLLIRTYVTDFPRPQAVAETWSAVSDSSFNLSHS